jgi:type VI secretion system secreted protein Hcp
MDVLIIDLTTASIKGETLLPDYKDQIEILSFSHGVAQQITGDQSNQKRTSGKPNHQDFTLTKYMDLATTSIVDCCNQAKPVPSVVFTIGQNDNGAVDKIMVVTMTNALISSYSVGGGGGGKPQETVTLNYTAIKWEYKVQKSDVSDSGTASATWNLATNATT